jgi:hypothetical protein
LLEVTMFRSALIIACLAAVTACDSASITQPTSGVPGVSGVSSARHGMRGVLRRVSNEVVNDAWLLEFADQTTAMLIGGPTALYAELENKNVFVVGLVGMEGIIVDSMEEDTRILPEFKRRAGSAAEPLRRAGNASAFMRRPTKVIP